MSLIIRRAESADAALVHGFIVKLAEYEKLSHEVEASVEQIGAQLFGDDPKVFCEIAELDGEPVGFALWFYTFSTFQGRHGIWLEDLYVDPQTRGKGIGKALRLRAVEMARERGYNTLVVEPGHVATRWHDGVRYVESVITMA